MKAKSERLHFTVCFDGMTDRVHEFWAEGKYTYTFHLCMAGFNLTEQQASKLINGTARMAQDPKGKIGCQGILVPESRWKAARAFPGCRYPKATTVAAAERDERMVLTARLAEEEARYMAPDAIRDRANQTLALMGAAPLPTPEQFCERVLELDKRPTPKPDTTYESSNGWVLRDGKFYPCENSMEHIWLADRLGKTEGAAEKAGWVKLTTPLMGVYVMSSSAPTQRQIDTVFSWAAHPKRRVGSERAAKEWLENHK